MTTDASATHLYAECSDADLAALLERALADRISCADLAERSRRLRPGYADLDPAAREAVDREFGFGVQHESDWRDYLAWDDTDDWEAGDDGGDLPLRFATEKSARIWWQVGAEQEFRVRYRRWQGEHAQWLPRRALYERRVQALKDADLWIQPGESRSPLWPPTGPAHQPTREGGPHRGTRVVPDRAMDTPILEWALEDH